MNELIYSNLVEDIPLLKKLAKNYAWVESNMKNPPKDLRTFICLLNDAVFNAEKVMEEVQK